MQVPLSSFFSFKVSSNQIDQVGFFFFFDWIPLSLRLLRFVLFTDLSNELVFLSQFTMIQEHDYPPQNKKYPEHEWMMQKNLMSCQN